MLLSYSTTVGNVPYYRMATTRDESGATILIKILIRRMLLHLMYGKRSLP
jgi:hypothetical protein